MNIEILDLRALPPEKREQIYKEALRQARFHLQNGQLVVGAGDSRWKKLNDIIGLLEEEIMKKKA